MAESKVVIRINYDKDKQDKPSGGPKTVTVWHLRRIAAAIAVLVLLIGLLVFLLGSDKNGDSGQAAAPSSTPLAAESSVTPAGEASPGAIESAKQAGGKYDTAIIKPKALGAIIFDKKVIRASLNTALKDNEPFEQVRHGLRLDENQSVQLHYFNELRDIKDRVLYHYWSKDGKPVLKKQLEVKAGHTKVVSEKTLFAKDKGEWKIQLVDRKGKVFCEVVFTVN